MDRRQVSIIKTYIKKLNDVILSYEQINKRGSNGILEVQVFEEEVSSKSGIKLRKVRRNYLVNQSVTASEAMVYKWLTDSPLTHEVISSKNQNS